MTTSERLMGSADTTFDETLRNLLEKRETCRMPRKMGERFIRCGSTDAARCPSCAAVSERYTQKLMEAGIVERETTHAYFLLTLTAPSFGRTHSVPKSEGEGVKRCACGETHSFGDALAGVPLDMRRYRYAEQIRWNENSSALFHTTMTRIKTAHPDAAHAAVREYQARAAIHIHAVIRVPVAEAAAAYETILESRYAESKGYKWGRSSDVRLVAGEALDDTITALSRVARYAVKTIGASHDTLSDEQRAFVRRLDKSAIALGLTEKKLKGYGYGGNIYSNCRQWSDTTKASLKAAARERAMNAVEPFLDLKQVSYRQRLLDTRALMESQGMTGDYSFDTRLADEYAWLNENDDHLMFSADDDAAPF